MPSAIALRAIDQSVEVNVSRLSERAELAREAVDLERAAKVAQQMLLVLTGEVLAPRASGLEIAVQDRAAGLRSVGCIVDDDGAIGPDWSRGFPERFTVDLAPRADDKLVFPGRRPAASSLEDSSIAPPPPASSRTGPRGPQGGTVPVLAT